MVFSKIHKQLLDDFSIVTSDGKLTERVPSSKYLGIGIEDKLLFNVHIAED